MEIGAIIPQKEIGHDIGALRAFAQAAEDLATGILSFLMCCSVTVSSTAVNLWCSSGF